MTVETLVAAVGQDTKTLAERMHLETDAILINQCEENAYQEYCYKAHTIRCYSFRERGVGLSRNNALLRATGDILLFSDEDIVYEEGYSKKILQAFADRPKADMLLFNVDVTEERATYHTTKEHRVRSYNCGRYPAYSIAVRREKLQKANVTFSLLFGGGAKYSNGEDSLFLMDCLRKHLHIVAVPISIGKEVVRPSTWFHGYTEKFFFDRGVLYYHLYGRLRYLWALRFLWAHGKVMCQDIPRKQAYALMKQGFAEGAK